MLKVDTSKMRTPAILLFLVIIIPCKHVLSSDVTAFKLPKFIKNYELVDIGLEVFDISLPEAKRQKALERYIKHPLMQLALKRYSSKRRPVDSRVNEKIYRDFVFKLWKGDYNKIQHPRMKYVLKPHKWGIHHLEDVKNDHVLVKKNMDTWLRTAMKKIPFNTPAASHGKRPIYLVFLFDPGGSYPWVWDTEDRRYIYFDVLQLRGVSEGEREMPFRERAFIGFLVHELFHQFQDDRFKGEGKADWLLSGAVGEGSAMLIGNNVFGVDGKKFYSKEPVFVDGKLLQEWKTEIPKVRERIKAFIALYDKWKALPPTEQEYFREISKSGWVATPENGFLTGDIYRVGAQMLLDIKEEFGIEKFYKVVGNSGALISTWKMAKR